METASTSSQASSPAADSSAPVSGGCPATQPGGRFRLSLGSSLICALLVLVFTHAPQETIAGSGSGSTATTADTGSGSGSGSGGVGIETLPGRRWHNGVGDGVDNLWTTVENWWACNLDGVGIRAANAVTSFPTVIDPVYFDGGSRFPNTVMGADFTVLSINTAPPLIQGFVGSPFIGPLSIGGNNTLTITGDNAIDVSNPATGSLATGLVTISVSSLVFTSATPTITANNPDGVLITSPITSAGVLTKAGTSSLTLTGTSAYTGATHVAAGSLIVNGALTDGDSFTVDRGAMLAGTGTMTPAVDQSFLINGALSVGDPLVAPTPSILSLTTSGAGSIVMGVGSAIVVDLFTGAGLGNNTAISTAADQLNLHGHLDASAGGTLVIGNPNAMTAFAIGDQWKVLELNSAGPNAGSITGNLAVDSRMLGLAYGLAGSLDQTTGIYSIVDYRAQTTATDSGLPMANAQGQMLINAGNTVTNDLNNHLFNLRAGGGEEDSDGSIASSMDDGVVVGQGDGSEDPIARKIKRSRQWEVFTTVNYGNVRLSAIGGQAGVQVSAWAPSIGIERHLSRGLALGFAASFLTSDQNYTGGLGSLHLEGPALSAYISFVRKNYWSSLLYSFGTYEMDSRRNPGFAFPMAFGTTRTYTNSVQYNTGWNFRFQNDTLVTGPFAGIDYLHGSVDAYSETGGGLAALRYGKQSYESLVSRVGWSASKKIQTDWATITPQVLLSYERQNLKNNGTSVALINAPFSASGGNQSPGQDYMVAGAGVNFQFTDRLNVLLSYQGQFFRNNQEAHFGSVRIGYSF